MDFLGLSTKCTCPSCFNEIDLADCRILSGRTSGKVLKDRPKGMLAHVRKIEPLHGQYYTLELAHRECPECGYLLPENIENVPSIILVVVGDVFSGKSHYIASFIHQLKTEWTSNSSGFARFICLTQDIEKIYIRDYFEPLFTHQKVLHQTQVGTSQYAHPLIYKLATNSSPKRLTTVANLMIYDTSGEDFEDESRLVNVARFALNTNAFIFIADPFTMQPFFSTLSPTMQTVIRGRRAAERLSYIISMYERYRGRGEGGSLPDVPIAVMVSKSDMFKPPIQPKNYSFMSNPPNYGNGIDLNDLNIVDFEVRELLKTYHQSDLFAATHMFRRIKFFATSATGESPDANGDFAHIEPIRCLDPVLWILHQLGIIRAGR